VYVSPLACS